MSAPAVARKPFFFFPDKDATHKGWGCIPVSAAEAKQRGESLTAGTLKQRRSSRLLASISQDGYITWNRRGRPPPPHHYTATNAAGKSGATGGRTVEPENHTAEK